jgi:hypothetical protein
MTWQGCGGKLVTIFFEMVSHYFPGGDTKKEEKYQDNRYPYSIFEMGTYRILDRKSNHYTGTLHCRLFLCLLEYSTFGHFLFCFRQLTARAQILHNFTLFDSLHFYIIKILFTVSMITNRHYPSYSEIKQRFILRNVVTAPTRY